jgi:hypothetical protein
MLEIANCLLWSFDIHHAPGIVFTRFHATVIVRNFLSRFLRYDRIWNLPNTEMETEYNEPTNAPLYNKTLI